MTIRDTDHGYRALMQTLGRRALSKVVVGVLDRDASSTDGHDTLLAVAIAHEFGSQHLPARSFLRGWADERRAANVERLRAAARRILAGENERTVLGAMGREMAAEITERMRGGIAPPLAASTVARKGEATPLVGGPLEHAISSEVRAA